MPGSITLPQALLDLEDQDRASESAAPTPHSVVCRYGHMRLVAELPFDGPSRPGCGSKLVIRTARGIELAETLTTTCTNGGCGLSITRKQMLDYISASGGRNFPFSTEGRVLRIAVAEDVQEQAQLDARKPELLRFAKELVRSLSLPMKMVEVELLLGGERIMFHYASDQWVDFRELVRLLAAEYQTRIEMHQVNSRDEARLVADYEKCGQHCCCRQFLKVLAPVSMRSAKTQKATLDPTKISGRCGRLMCCLRYEDQTYDYLKKKLPHRQSRTMTPDGPGTVLDTQVLSQLVLVALDNAAAPVAFPLEQLRPLTKSEDPKFNAPPDQRLGSAGGPARETRNGGGKSGVADSAAARSSSPPAKVARDAVEPASDDSGEMPAGANSGPLISDAAMRSDAAAIAADAVVEENSEQSDEQTGASASAAATEDIDSEDSDGSDAASGAATSGGSETPAGDSRPSDPASPDGGGQSESGAGRRRRRRRRRRGRGGGGGGGPNPLGAN